MHRSYTQWPPLDQLVGRIENSRKRANFRVEPMNDKLDTNQQLWNAWTDLHETSDFYDLPGFKAGKSSLRPIERAELTDVAGRSLLHLQCHFGLDTLSWARKGAIVTGIDFSDRSITL